MGARLATLSSYVTGTAQQPATLAAAPAARSTVSTSAAPPILVPPSSSSPTSSSVVSAASPLPPAPPHELHIHAAERAFLSLFGAPRAVKHAVALPSGSVINTLTFGPPTAPTLVLLHGWGAGAAFFARNVAPLSTRFRVHAIDWLGFGASSRPPFSRVWSAATAERFFVDALQDWLDAMPRYEPSFPARVHLVAHSLGAYLATAFALRFPHLVASLVLASPAGVPRPPRNKLPVTAIWRRALFSAAFIAWDAGLTPQMLVRCLPAALARRLAGAIILPRLVVDDVQQQHAIRDYFYAVSAAPGSGEFSLCTILESGAYARRPLVDRLTALRTPVSFLFGDRDWIKPHAVREVAAHMSAPTEIIMVPHAGHHVYFDNADFFNDFVVRQCAKYTQGDLGSAAAAPPPVSPQEVAP